MLKSDKCLRVVGTDWASEQQSVDPLINNNVADLMRLTTIYEKLVELDNGYQPIPVLAESWESDPTAPSGRFIYARASSGMMAAI